MSDADERKGAGRDDRKRDARGSDRTPRGGGGQRDDRRNSGSSRAPSGRDGDRRDGQRRYSEHREGGQRRDGAHRNSGDRRDGDRREGGSRPYTPRDGSPRRDGDRGGQRRDNGYREGAPRRDGDSRTPYRGGESRAGRTYNDDRRASGDRDRSGSSYRGSASRNDRPYGDKPRSDRPYGDKPRGDRPYGDKPRGDRPYGDKPRGDRPYGDKRSHGDKPRGDRPYGDKPRGDRPYGEKRSSGEKRPYGDKPRGDRPYGDRSHSDWKRRDDRGDDRRSSRPPQDERARRAPEPELPDDITARDLHPSARNELKTLSKENAEAVARHLAMAGILIDEDPARAHEHALAASRRAGRVAVVRETVAITAYAIGDYPLALRELRTYRRISGKDDQIALIVDSERGVGRPERALEEGRSVDRASLPIPVRVQLAIAMSGARLDLGQPDSALLELDIPELDPDRAFEWSPALFLARATVLEELGRTDEASQWERRAEVAAEALDAAAGVGEDETIEVEEIEIEAHEIVDEPAEDSDAADDAGSDLAHDANEMVVVDELIEDENE